MTFELFSHAAFEADEFWGDKHEPTRIMIYSMYVRSTFLIFSLFFLSTPHRPAAVGVRLGPEDEEAETVGAAAAPAAPAAPAPAAATPPATTAAASHSAGEAVGKKIAPALCIVDSDPPDVFFFARAGCWLAQAVQYFLFVATSSQYAGFSSLYCCCCEFCACAPRFPSPFGDTTCILFTGGHS